MCLLARWRLDDITADAELDGDRAGKTFKWARTADSFRCTPRESIIRELNAPLRERMLHAFSEPHGGPVTRYSEPDEQEGTIPDLREWHLSA